MFEIDYFKTADGKCPIVSFLNGLNPKMKAKVFGRIELLEEYGPLLTMPFSKLLEDGIYELRTPQGNNITRVLYFFVSNKRVILTHGFIKKTQKTPRTEIEKAKKMRADWEKRYE